MYLVIWIGITEHGSTEKNPEESMSTELFFIKFVFTSQWGHGEPELSRLIG